MKTSYYSFFLLSLSGDKKSIKSNVLSTFPFSNKFCLLGKLDPVELPPHWSIHAYQSAGYAEPDSGYSFPIN